RHRCRRRRSSRWRVVRAIAHWPAAPPREPGGRSAKGQAGASSSYLGHDEIRHEDLSLGLRSEQQCDYKARRTDASADQHRDRKAEIVMAGEPGQDQRDKAAEYRTLVITEGARRRAHLGREAFGEVSGVLAIDRLAEKA